MNDDANCGACGHSCLGGACEKGLCLPTVLATGSPVSLAADGTNLYWTDATIGQVLGCPASGCPEGGTVLYAGPGGGPGFVVVGGIAVQSGQFFFLDGTGGTGFEVLACPVAGCGDTGPVIAPGFGDYYAGNIAVDSNQVYFGTQGGVEVCPYGDAGAPPTQIISSQGQPTPIPFPVVAAGGGWLFFDNPMYGIGGCEPPSACNCGSDICGARVGTSGSTAASGIAVGPGAVYWTSGNLNGLFARPLEDAGASTLFAAAGGPGAVVADAEDVYFGSTDDGGTLYRCAVKGCAQTPTPVAAGLGAISSLALDATRVYAVVSPTTNPAPGGSSSGGPPPMSGSLPIGSAIIVLAR
jgi:hypothetical protein